MRTLRNQTDSSAARRGAALIVAVLFMLVLGGMAASLAVLNATFHKEHSRSREEARSFYAAEAGANEALAVLMERGRAEAEALVYPRSLGEATYRVEVAFGDADPAVRADRVRLRSVGNAGVRPVGVELMLERVRNGDFGRAIAGDESVLLETGCMVDSYDSGDGPYPTAVAYANSAGHVASNDDIVFQANVAVYGDVMAGPMGTVDDSATGITVDGEVGMAEALIGFDPVVVPGFLSSGSQAVIATTLTLTGDVYYTDIDIDAGTLVIVGPARVVLDDLDLDSMSELQIDATNGPVEIYGTGDFFLAENSDITVTTPQPRDVALYLTGSNMGTGTDMIILDSDGDFHGTIYAPDARIDVDNEFHVYGAVKARSVQLEFDGEVHFDEDLLYGVAPLAEIGKERFEPAEIPEKAGPSVSWCCIPG